MSWYYVGPDASPVGPISLEELQARRAAGAIAPETYVIEAPAGSAPKEWRRYRELFPAATGPAAALPPLPTASAPPPQTPTMGIPHPLFPSAAPATPSPGGPVFTGAHPSTYRLPPPKNNPWCVWGFGLGIASLPCLLCGIGFLLAPVALVVNIIGLVQVNHHREQHGRGLAITGLVASLLALLLGAILIGAAVSSSSWHSVVSMTTEQTSNDSDTK